MNPQEMMRQLNRMQAKIQKVQEEVGARTFEGTAGGGMVVVAVSGKGELTGVKIDPQVVDPKEIEMLQDMMVAATNQALARAHETMQGELQKVTGGMGLPGMF